MKERVRDSGKIIVLIALMLFLLSGCGGDSVDDKYEKTGKYLKEMTEETSPFVDSVGGEWVVIGLARSGTGLSEEAEEAYLYNVEKYVKENINEQGQLDKSKSTENSRILLALTALGENPADFAGYDLIQGLSDMDFVSRQGLNGTIWALIALDSGDYNIPDVQDGGRQTTREALLDEIISSQTKDGGWALVGDTADPDMTGMALQALAAYYEDETVKDAADKAVRCLSDMQGEDGGYSSWGNANSESCSQVIVALTALGIDPNEDERFVKNDKSLIDALLSFYSDDGGFKHTLDQTAQQASDAMATEQAYYALTAYHRFTKGQTALYDMSDVK